MKSLAEIKSAIVQIENLCYICIFKTFRVENSPCSNCLINKGKRTVNKPDNTRIKRIAESISE